MKTIGRNFICGLSFLWVFLPSTYAQSSCYRDYVPKIYQGFFQSPNQIATGNGVAWVKNGDGTVTRISSNPSDRMKIYGTRDGINSAMSIAANTKGDLWVLNKDHTLTKLLADGSGPSAGFSLSAVGAPLRFLVTDSKDNLWAIGDKDVIMLPEGTLPEEAASKLVANASINQRVQLPVAATAGPNGEMWFVDEKNLTYAVVGSELDSHDWNTIQFRPGRVIATTMPNKMSKRNDLLVLNIANNTISQFKAAGLDASGNIAVNTLSGALYGAITYMVVDPKGNLWIAGLDFLTKLSPAPGKEEFVFDRKDFSLSEYGVGGIASLGVDAEGNIWVSDTQGASEGGQVTKLEYQQVPVKSPSCPS